MSPMRTCPRCGGAQYDPEYQEQVICGTCRGSGGWYVTREMSIDAYGDARAEGTGDPCPSCQGHGFVPEPAACRKCGGYGEVPVEGER